MEPTTTRELEAIREQAMCPEEMKLLDEMLHIACWLTFAKDHLEAGGITQDEYASKKRKAEAQVITKFYDFLHARL